MSQPSADSSATAFGSVVQDGRARNGKNVIRASDPTVVSVSTSSVAFPQKFGLVGGLEHFLFSIIYDIYGIILSN